MTFGTNVCDNASTLIRQRTHQIAQIPSISFRDYLASLQNGATNWPINSGPKSSTIFKPTGNWLSETKTCLERKNQNPEINNIQAFEIFMTTKEYEVLSSGEFHDKWFLELKKNKYIDSITKKKINEETLRLLELQKNSMVKFLMKIPKLYYTKSHFPLEISQRAFDHLWRVCESYEMWCKETKQENLIYLNIIE